MTSSVMYTADHDVVLFTEEQLNEVTRFGGADAPNNMRSVLCVDRF